MNRKERNASLERVIDDYSNILYKICFMISKNEQDTKDVLQDTFITYMTKSPEFHFEEHKKAWLIKVSQNKCREFLRFHKRHERFYSFTRRVSLTDVKTLLNQHS